MIDGFSLLLSLIAGLLSGVAATALLFSLNFVTDLRLAHPELLWGLPLAGLLIGWSFHRWGRKVSGGTRQVFDEIHDLSTPEASSGARESSLIPGRMAPMIFIGTLLTHLFGGSAGREGTAVQMGASLAETCAKQLRLPLNPQQRRTLLVAAVSSAFGAAIGAPLAGGLFGMEVAGFRNFRAREALYFFLASLVGVGVSTLLRAPHSFLIPIGKTCSYLSTPLVCGQRILDRDYRASFFSGTLISTTLSLCFLGVLFGLTARFFIFTTGAVRDLLRRWVHTDWLRPFVGGLLLALFFSHKNFSRYEGLSTRVIDGILRQQGSLFESLQRLASTLSEPGSIFDPLYKILFTSLTIGSGFKGGEFVPLLFVGTTLGSALSTMLPLSISLASRLGFVSVFAAASRTPLTCTLLFAELFGPELAPLALLTCLIASSRPILGHRLTDSGGIYRSKDL